MTKTDFAKWKFAGSLPAVIVLNLDPPQIPMGAITTEFDIAPPFPTVALSSSRFGIQPRNPSTACWLRRPESETDGVLWIRVSELS